jgi:hypothetical protein
MGGKRWSEDEVKILRKNYGRMPRGELLGLLNGRSYDSISNKAYSLDLAGDSRNANRKYNVNFLAFSEVDADSAYWAGFIAADGHLTKNSQLCVGISNKDKQHLQKLKTYLGYTGPLREECRLTNFGSFDRVELRVQSVDVCRNLHEVFCIPVGRKSDILTVPDIDIEFLVDYIAGYFDGDGCLYADKRGYITITFVGNRRFLCQVKIIIDKYFDINTAEPYQNNQASEARTYRIHGQKAIDVLSRFNDNQNGLRRKRIT